jgi:hypothetical protein
MFIAGEKLVKKAGGKMAGPGWHFLIWKGRKYGVTVMSPLYTLLPALYPL